MKMNSALIAQIWACRNCLRQLYFKSKWRGIGYSFQLAITAPLYSITGYCIATAQSCGLQTLFHWYTYLPSNPCWFRKVTFYSISWFKRISHVNLAQLDELLFPSNIYCALICHCQKLSQFRNSKDSKLYFVWLSITTKLIIAWIHFYKRCVSNTDISLVFY